MKCPTCPDSVLVMSERQGVEIDYCPQCRGVWLDRGELDKIIERASTELGSGQPAPAVASPPPPAPAPRYEDRKYDDRKYDDRDARSRYDDHDHKPKKKKKTSFLEDLFEF